MDRLGLPEPPSNLGAENALLGAILCNPRALDLCGGLSAEMFYEPVNGWIFDACKRRIEVGKQADPVTLKSALEAAMVLSDAHSASGYLAALVTAMISIDGVASYAEVIRDCHVRRQALALVEEMKERILSADTGMAAISFGLTAMEDLGEASGSGLRESTATMQQAAEGAMVRAERAAQGLRDAVGLTTGIESLDRALSGMHAGSLTVIAARSGEGKSALAGQILRHVASIGVPCRGFSMEMSKEDIGTVNLVALSGVPADTIRAGSYSNDEAEALLDAQMALSGMSIKMTCRSDITLSEAISETRVAVRRDKIRLVVYDHRDLFARDLGHERDPEIVWYRYVTRRLKAAAAAMGIAAIVLIQLSRDIERREDKRPRKSDLYGGGEQDADDIVMIFRPELHAPEQPKQGERDSAEIHAMRLAAWHRDAERNRGRAELYLVKRRFGPPSMVALQFDGPSLTFRD